eukprot:CAMPEP_0184327696 /NCGR_PEP_ID=MMETSP1049-20130417/143229_1 /TAXON_ID=77928 /ORGANISM="Proteomonas sulcata, Strain CCMP704" /LENGTH=119 /DNA_ID=CAMNT_0026649963 /DNA_START=64 /DNA_END=423 /DNA_ORIENTATION=-
MKELSKIPEEQELHFFLPDVCRSRYEAPDLKGQIGHLIKHNQGKKPEAELDIAPFRDEELRQSFSISNLQPGPPPLPIRAYDPEDEKSIAEIQKQNKANERKRKLRGDESGGDIKRSKV